MARLLLLLTLYAVQTCSLVLESNTWSPTDSVHALDAVITAVNSIVTNPHLSPAHLKQAKSVAEDIKKDIEFVESGHLTKQQTNAKIGAAIKELASFESVFVVKKASNSMDERIQKLQQELVEKKKALAREESMMKLLKLKKALAEKKMMLERMIMKKSEAANGQSQEADLAEAGSAISKLLSMAKTTASSPDGLKAISAALQEREKVVSESLSNLNKLQSKGDAQIDAVIKSQMDLQNQGKMDTKKKSLFKHLKLEENRKFAKARALKEHELTEIQAAEKSAQQKDVSGLTHVLARMLLDNQHMKARSGNFLH